MNTDVHPPLESMHPDDLRLIKTNIQRRAIEQQNKINRINRLLFKKDFKRKSNDKKLRHGHIIPIKTGIVTHHEQ